MSDKFRPVAGDLVTDAVPEASWLRRFAWRFLVSCLLVGLVVGGVWWAGLGTRVVLSMVVFTSPIWGFMLARPLVELWFEAWERLRGQARADGRLQLVRFHHHRLRFEVADDAHYWLHLGDLGRAIGHDLSPALRQGLYASALRPGPLGATLIRGDAALYWLSTLGSEPARRLLGWLQKGYLLPARTVKQPWKPPLSPA